MNANNWRVAVRRRKRTQEVAAGWWHLAFAGWLVASGGASGILIAVLILNAIHPGHPYYAAVQQWLRSWF